MSALWSAHPIYHPARKWRACPLHPLRARIRCPLPCLRPLPFVSNMPPNAVRRRLITTYGHLLWPLGQPERQSPVKYQCLLHRPKHVCRLVSPRAKSQRPSHFSAIASTCVYRQIVGAMHRAARLTISPPTHVRVLPWRADWSTNRCDGRYKSMSELPRFGPKAYQHRLGCYPAAQVHRHRRLAG